MFIPYGYGVRVMEWIRTNWVVEPAVPGPVRGDYVIAAAEHVRAQEPLLYSGFCFGAPFAAIMGDGLNPGLRFGLPLAIFAICILGIFLRRKAPTTERRAIRALATSALGAGGVIALGSLWAVLSWQAAPEVSRFGYPFVMALGVVVSGYAFAKVRRIAAVCLVVGITPIAAVLLLQGNVAEKTCALALLVAGLYLFIMARNDRRFLVELLEKRQRLHALSRLDSLTDLPNRRAFLDDAYQMGTRAKELRLILVDLDRFKTINDTYGHDTGDEVLRKVARIIEGFAVRGVSAARVGGEEFALVGKLEDLSAVCGLHLLTTLRETGMPHGSRVTASIGIASGPLKTDRDWKRLYSQADKALYQAKAEGRDCAVAGPSGPSAEMIGCRGERAA